MKIEFVGADDWVELFIDGNLAYRNHSISAEKVLELLNIEYTSTYFEEEDEFAEYIQTHYPT